MKKYPSVEVKKLYVCFDRYIDILHCTLRVYTVICTKCVERESCTCTSKCRRTREMEKIITLILQKWTMFMHRKYSDGYGICTFVNAPYIWCLVRSMY